MAAADPESWTGQATINSTNYTAASAPSLNATATIGAGRWTLHNASTTLYIIVSQDGTNDYTTIPPATSWTSESAGMVGKLWAKLSAAGSTTLTGQITHRNAVVS